MQNISAARAKQRAIVASASRAVRNGEDRPETKAKLHTARRELAVIAVEEEHDRLAAKAAQLVASWPDLTDEQIDRVAIILRGGAAQ